MSLLRFTEQVFSLLNMRSAIDSKDRLIEVATKVFGREGFAGTSLRMIAIEAGVSAALLVHHFGSKQHLVEQTISQTLGEWMREKDELSKLSISDALAEWPVLADKGQVKLAFFKQVMLAGGKPAQILLERMHQEAKDRILQFGESGKMRKLEDPDTAALLIAIYGLAPLLMSDSIKKILGGDITDKDVSEKLARSSLELFALFPAGENQTPNRESAGEQ
jgi:TetR/AcrR family transcriptional regulator, regulator of cefoperazone and chloramphenicol sensitivity